jgi:hypothetical protein
MTLIYPDEPSLNVSPESQTGTWMEERAETIAVTDRPRLTARKSRCRIEDLPLAVQSVAGPNVNGQVEIDPLVRQLGIGWKRLSDTQQSAIAGSETYIRKQFDLNEPHIALHHEGLGIYVVRSEPASAQGYWSQWWLFREDLRSSRFLCNDDSLMERLNNKKQDERGHWVPDIRCSGPEVLAKDVRTTPTFNAEVFTTATNPVHPETVMAIEQPVVQQQHQCPANEDIEMEGVA